MMTPLNGFEIRQASVLAGGKKAVKMGRVVYVSPAMYALMVGASGDELERLLGKIEVVEVPEMDFNLDLLTTAAPAGF